jgi:murein DD-endopeptidase MepM/ murein hydrolase activator NlpD
LLLELEPAFPAFDMTTVTVFHNGKRIPIFRKPSGNSQIHCGLVGIPLEAEPGESRIDLAGSDGGRRFRMQARFRVVRGRYRTVKLRVDPRKVTLSEADRKRVQRESARIRAICATGMPTRFWEEAFQLPVASEITSPFGVRRVFNDLVHSYHSGVDLRAPVGQPVFASNAGTVRLAETLFYSGNAVIIDHGTGIFTSYSHLSRLDVRPGQGVRKGQQLGLAGATGRVSGAHLHWGVRVNTERVDPMAFLRTVDSLVDTDRKR